MIWKNITGYESRYKVSNTGKIFSIKSQKILKTSTQSNGKYETVVLCKEGKTKCFRVHRLVLQAFYPKNNPHLEVNHIDFNIFNNKIENLEWVTRSQNRKHSYDAGRVIIPRPFLGKFGKDHNRSKDFFLLKDEILNYYESGLQFHKITGLDHTAISYARKLIQCRGLESYKFIRGAMKNSVLFLKNPHYELC